MIKKLGIHMSAAESQELFDSMDVDGSKKIEIGEFIDHWEEIRNCAEKAHEKVKAQLAETTTFTKSEIDAMHQNFKMVSKRVVDDGVIDAD
eukprot:gene1124-5829_t